LISEAETKTLFQKVVERGGHISMKRNTDGSESPYEANITYFDALSDPGKSGSPLHQRRFLCSQTLALELRGIPAIYLHSLTATANDHEGVTRTGQKRSINRKSWAGDELNRLLDDRSSITASVFREYLRILRIRRSHSAFHPDGPQRVLDLGSRLFGIRRTAPDGSETVLCVNNLSPRSQEFVLDDDLLSLSPGAQCLDLLKERRMVSPNSAIQLRPYESCWLRVHQS
jgi:sucrose phosphorylase